MNKAVILDRDGTINVDLGYVHKAEEFMFIRGAVYGLKQLYNSGFKLFIATNQSGIARGYYSVDDVEDVHAYMLDELKKQGVFIEKVYFCPHHPSVSKCGCRKPEPGMLEMAIGEFGLDPSCSFMVGDKSTDILAGRRAGVRTVIVGGNVDFADYRCRNLAEASEVILGEMP